ncbi:unnamed protein product [Laminaria digitata]
MDVFPEAEVRRDGGHSLGFWWTSINAAGVPPTVECVSSDNGTEFVKPEFVEILDRRGFFLEYTPVGSPKHNGAIDRQIAMTLELAMVSFPETPRLFGEAGLRPTGPVRAEACNYASDVLNMTARIWDKPERSSPHRQIYGGAPFARLLSFLKPGYHDVPRSLKAYPNVEACCYLNGGKPPDGLL